jgi:hypothetical protein
MLLVWIVVNEDTSEILGAFESRDNALKCISDNNSGKDNLILISEIVK